MERNIEEIRGLGKETIIRLAYKIMAEKHPEMEVLEKDYEIKVWANTTEVVVKFRRLIRYTPLAMEGSNLTFDLSVNVVTGRVSPFDFWPNKKLFMPQGQDKENYEFVLKHFGLPVKGFKNSVSEQQDHFFISLTNKAAFGKYFIDKITGKEKMSPIQGSYMQMPHPPMSPGNVNKDPLIEIKE